MTYTYEQMQRAFECGRNFQLTGENNFKELIIELTPKYVLLRGVEGNLFWTTNNGSNYEAQGLTVLHRANTVDEMTAKWDEHFRYLKW